MTAILGTNVLVYAGGNKIAMQKNATLNMTTDTIDVTNKDTEGWKDYLPGLRDWSLDCESMVVENDPGLVALENAYMTGSTQLSVAIQTPSDANKWTGSVMVKSLKYSAQDGGVYSAAVTLQGMGALEEA